METLRRQVRRALALGSSSPAPASADFRMPRRQCELHHRRFDHGETGYLPLGRGQQVARALSHEHVALAGRPPEWFSRPARSEPACGTAASTMRRAWRAGMVDFRGIPPRRRRPRPPAALGHPAADADDKNKGWKNAI